MPDKRALIDKNHHPTLTVENKDVPKEIMRLKGEEGNLLTRTSPQSVLHARSTAYSDSLAVPTAKKLVEVRGYNSGPVQFVQIHNTTSKPENDAVPLETYKMLSNRSFSITPQRELTLDAVGVTLVNSTTGETLTSGADDVWFIIDYTD